MCSNVIPIYFSFMLTPAKNDCIICMHFNITQKEGFNEWLKEYDAGICDNYIKI
jgi:hypothetical protein